MRTCSPGLGTERDGLGATTGRTVDDTTSNPDAETTPRASMSNSTTAISETRRTKAAQPGGDP